MPGYEVKQEQVAIAGVASLTIRSLLDRQQFSDPGGLAEAVGISSAAWPLFGLIWPSGIHLADAVMRRAALPDDSVLEIGCGLALASLACHRRGQQVTASDCHPLAATFLLENLRLNGLAPMRYCHGDWAQVPGEEARLAAGYAPFVRGRFSLIMGSDVMYERDDGGVLARFIEHHALPCSEVMIVDPNRGNRSALQKRMTGLGYTLEDTSLSHAAEGDQAAYKGRLLHWRRAG